MQAFPDEIAPTLARWLAPYVAAELAGHPPDHTARTHEYDAVTCKAYVRELGQGVLNRAADFFRKLGADGSDHSNLRK